MRVKQQGHYYVTTTALRKDQLLRLDALARQRRRSRSWMLREMLDRAFARTVATPVPDEAA